VAAAESSGLNKPLLATSKYTRRSASALVALNQSTVYACLPSNYCARGRENYDCSNPYLGWISRAPRADRSLTTSGFPPVYRSVATGWRVRPSVLPSRLAESSSWLAPNRVPR
jgi:hypothetical protein